MFRFLCNNKNILQRRKLLNEIFLQYPKLFRSLSTTPTDSNNFTVSYLVNSCGLTQNQAIYASKKIQLKTKSQPDSVLTLLKNHEFPNTQISKIIRSTPSLLLSNKTLELKLEYFKSIGLSGNELANTIALHPTILKHDLDTQIIPAVAFLHTILSTDDKVIEMLKKRSVTVLLCANLYDNLVPNIQLLLAHGIPKVNISKLILYQPISLTTSVDHFKKVVEEVEEMDFDPLHFTFVYAVHAWSYITKTSTKETKFDVYKQWGWSEDHILAAFKQHPKFLKLSERTIMQKMEFLVSKMGYDPLVMAKCPKILSCGFESKIIPRCLVIEHLISNGLLKKNCNSFTALLLKDQKFSKRFVTKFKINVADLLDAFKGKTGS